jgi:hypothetical protein
MRFAVCNLQGRERLPKILRTNDSFRRQLPPYQLSAIERRNQKNKTKSRGFQESTEGEKYEQFDEPKQRVV